MSDGAKILAGGLIAGLVEMAPATAFYGGIVPGCGRRATGLVVRGVGDLMPVTLPGSMMPQIAADRMVDRGLAGKGVARS